MFKIRSLYVAALATAISVAAIAGGGKYGIEKAAITVNAKGPAGMAIDGKSSILKVDDDGKNLKFTAFWNSIDTGNGKRNTHMCERFEEKKFPEINLTIPRDKVDGKKSGAVDGSLKLHGVTKPVKVNYKVDGKTVTADFKFDLNDYGINDKQLCEAGICAKKDVGIVVKFDLKGG